MADQANSRTDQAGNTYQVRPEYAVMSKGLGLAWINKYHRDVYPHDFVVHNGRKYPVPRYYKEKLKQFDYDIQTIETKRVHKAKQHAEDNTPQRLAVQEKVHQAKVRDLRRGDHGL